MGCEFKTKTGICNGPDYAYKTVRILVDGVWQKTPINVCSEHAHKHSRYVQSTWVKTGEDNYSGERSPFWEWAHENAEGAEDDDVASSLPASHNPDQLAETDLLWSKKPLSDDDQELVEETFKKAGEVLTARQLEIFELLIYERRNQYEIAAKLNLTRRTVQEHIEAITKKLK